MGRAQIASDPPPLSEGPSVKRANVEKKCPIPSWQALTPLGNCGKNVPKTILASLYTSPPLPIWKQHISKGASLTCILIAFKQAFKGL